MTKDWMIQHKETKLYLQMERGVDFWTHDLKIATTIPTRKEAAALAKKLLLTKEEYEII